MTENTTPQMLTPPPQSLHPNVLEALKHPQRGAEMRGWLSVHPEKALAWKGEFGETMMHWAFLSDWVFACELRDKGLSFDDVDSTNRNPFDWLNDRLFGALVNENTKGQLSMGGQERLRKQTEQQAISLWNVGARPHLGYSIQDGFYGTVWLHAGCYALLPIAQEEHGVYDWLPSGGNLLHACVLAPHMPPLWDLLSQASQQLDIDEEDDEGRTPLWYCVDAWVKHPFLRKKMETLASHLIKLNAYPHQQSHSGYTPIDLLSFVEGTTNTKDMKDILLNNTAVSSL